MAKVADTIAGFGFCTDGAQPDLSDLDVQLGRIEATGASHCELSLYELDLIVGGRVLPERRRHLEQICARRALRYTAHGVLTVNFMDEAHLELHEAVCRATLELCDAVGASVLAHHPGKVPATRSADIERLHALERDTLRAIGEVAAGYGVRIAVENLFVENAATYTADPVRLASEIAAIDHPNVCGLLDFSHAYIMAQFQGCDFVETLARFAPEVNHLHVHDSFGRPRSIDGFFRFAEQIAFGMGDLHLPIGWGDIPWDAILPQLRLRPGTLLIVELAQRHFAELEPCAAAARRFAETINRAQAKAA
jgi:sugar phosphate isomerase/epimerase